MGGEHRLENVSRSRGRWALGLLILVVWGFQASCHSQPVAAEDDRGDTQCDNLLRNGANEWIADTSTLNALRGDVQAAVNCVPTHGLLLFDVEFLDLHKTTLTLDRPVRIGRHNANKKGPVKVECPKDGPAVRVISKGVSLSDLSFSDCKFNASAIVSLWPSSSATVSNSVFIKNENVEGYGCVFALNAKLALRNCSFIGNRGENGGAVGIDGGSGLHVRGSRFEGNVGTVGGALGAANADVTVVDSKFASNTARVGGAVYISADKRHKAKTAVEFKDVDFSSNSAYFGKVMGAGGGAVAVYDVSRFTMESCILDNNTVKGSGGGLFLERVKYSVISHSNVSHSFAGFGGGVYAQNFQAPPCILSLQEVLFESNRALSSTAEGGAVAVMGNGMSILITHSKFHNNSALWGGAVSFGKGPKVTGRGLEFVANEGLVDGGAFSVWGGGVAILELVLFENNTAPGNGGALYAFDRSDLNITDCSFFGNRAGTMGGGAFFDHDDLNEYGYQATENMDIFVYNSTFEHNTAGALIPAAKQGVSVASCLSGKGGAIAILGAGTLFDMQKSVIRNSTARLGGGIYWEKGFSMILRDTRIDGNKAAFGGGLHAQLASLQQRVFWVIETVFSNNRAQSGGGARLFAPRDLFLNVTGASLEGFGRAANLTHVTFVHNLASKQGGGVAVDGITLNCWKCELESNTAGLLDSSLATTGTGGAIQIGQCGFGNLYKVTVANNMAVVGGGVYVQDSGLNCTFVSFVNNSAMGFGGAMALKFSAEMGSMASFVTVCTSCVISGNEAKVGGGAHIVAERRQPDAQRQCSNLTSAELLERSQQCVFDMTQSCGKMDATPGQHYKQYLVLDGIEMAGNTAKESGSFLFANEIAIVAWCCNGGCSVLGVGSTKVPCVGEKGSDIEIGGGESVALVSSAVFNIDLNPVTIGHHTSGRDLNTVTVTMKDKLSQVIAGQTVKLVVMANTTGILSGAPVRGVQLHTGEYNVTDLTLTAPPGRYELLFQVSSELAGDEPISENLFVTVRECKAGEEMKNNNLTCLPCERDEYNLGGSGVCHSCPANAICNRSSLVPLEGFWQATSKSDRIEQCVLEEACSFPGRSVDLSRNSSLAHLEGGTLAWEDASYRQCAEGYTGPLCGSCSPDFGRTGSLECGKCPKQGAYISVAIGAVVLLLWAWVMTNSALQEGQTGGAKSACVGEGPSTSQQSTADYSYERDPVSIEQPLLNDEDGPGMLECSICKMQANRTTEVFKILLNFLQVVGTAAKINVHWTESVYKFLSLTDYTSGVSSGVGLSPLDCAFDATTAPRSIQSSLYQFLLPFGIWIIFLLLGFLQKLTRKVTRKDFNQRLLVALLIILYISYITITIEVVRMFHCVNVELPTNLEDMKMESTALWVVDTSVVCYNGPHTTATVVAVVLLAGVCIGYPFGLIIKLVRNRTRLDDCDFVGQYGYLYKAYKDRAMFWEAWVLLRKGGLAAITVFSNAIGPDRQSLLATSLLFFALWLHNAFEPYHDAIPKLNRLEGGSLQICMLTFLCGLMFNHNQEVQWAQMLVSIVLVTGVAGYALYLVFELVVSVLDSLKLWLEANNVATRGWAYNVRAAFGLVFTKAGENLEDLSGRLLKKDQNDSKERRMV